MSSSEGKMYSKMLLSVLYLLFFLGSSLCDSKDGGKAYRIPLNDGNSIPALGLGTGLGSDKNALKEGKVQNAVSWALNAGYRLFDSAAEYNNEDKVGEAVQNSNVSRENIFIVTKLGSKEHRNVVEALRNSLRRLNMTYVDLYLIHDAVAFTADDKFDVVDYIDTWKGMEEAKSLGLAKSIGISNFNISMIERLLGNCQVKPSVLQVEVHLNLAQNKLVDFCKEHDIVVMAFTPFGRLFSKDNSTPPPKVDDVTLTGIAKKYGKTTPQIVLRYLVQRGVVPIPKSFHKDRIEQNIDVFDFELTSEEMETLSKFNRDYRTDFFIEWQDHPYYPHERVEVPKPEGTPVP